MRRNDPRQYDELAEHWWKPDGMFAMLHWLARARCDLVPPPRRDDAVLVDIGCGGGLNAPHLSGYRHIGVDIRAVNAAIAAEHGVLSVCGDATRLPLVDECADVVVAGEVLEHVPDWRSVLAEACRVLKPGGTLIVDTLAKNVLSRLIAVHLAERVPGGPPPGIHDPSLFVPPRALRRAASEHGVDMALWGIRPAVLPLMRWLRHRNGVVPMVRTGSPLILYAGKGDKNPR